jgi:CMP-N-acetylneuraminic acid synthetase
MGIADMKMIRQILEAYLTCATITGILVETDQVKILCENIPQDASKTLVREERIRQRYRLCHDKYLAWSNPAVPIPCWVLQSRNADP